MTEIEKKLNEEALKMALENFDLFCQVTGYDATRAHVCLLKSKGKSYGQIALILGKTRAQVIGIFIRNCNCKQL